MNYYLLIIWNDVEPDVAGPYFTTEHRDNRAYCLRKERGENTGIYKLDINNKGNPYISAYSNRFFERGEE